MSDFSEDSDVYLYFSLSESSDPSHEPYCTGDLNKSSHNRAPMGKDGSAQIAHFQKGPVVPAKQLLLK